MNNNLDPQYSKPNILNEIAANNQLLQQSNYQNSINKNQMHPTNNNSHLMQQMYQNQMKNKMYNRHQSDKQEIELSDIKSENGDSLIDLEQLNPNIGNNQISSQNNQYQNQTQRMPSTQHPTTNQIPNQQPSQGAYSGQIPNPNPHPLPTQMPVQTQPQLQPQLQPDPQIQNSAAPGRSKTKELLKSLVLCLFVFVLFVLLVYPKTSNLLDKYIPPISNIKGIVVRAGILAGAYLILNVIINFIV